MPAKHGKNIGVMLKLREQVNLSAKHGPLELQTNSQPPENSRRTYTCWLRLLGSVRESANVCMPSFMTFKFYQVACYEKYENNNLKNKEGKNGRISNLANLEQQQNR